MIETIRNAWKIPELRKKILFTIFALLIFRLGSVVPVPFINSEALGTTLNSMGGIFSLLGTMNGTAFSMAAVFALGVQPYINSSIIIQLLTVAIPALERLQRDGGEEGRKKIAAITRYVTVAIAILQGLGYYTLINSYNLIDNAGLPGWWVAIVIILCFTAGSAFVMWLGEQITEFGIGNGISIILFAGILSRVPGMVMTVYTGVRNNLNGVTGENVFNLPWWGAILIVIGMLALVVELFAHKYGMKPEECAVLGIQMVGGLAASTQDRLAIEAAALAGEQLQTPGEVQVSFVPAKPTSVMDAVETILANPGASELRLASRPGTKPLKAYWSGR